jgi:hypothetical protein
MPTAAERMERKRQAKEQPKVDYYLAQKAKALAYDYADIPQEHRELVQRAALDIRSRLKRTVEDMIEIGRQLSEVRDALLDDGKYHQWLKVEFGMSIGSASEYRSIAARFGGEVSIIETLSPTIVRRLAASSVPIEAIEAVRLAAQAKNKPLKVREAMAIIRPFRTPKVVKPKQLPGPVAETEHDAIIEAEYTVIQSAAAEPAPLTFGAWLVQAPIEPTLDECLGIFQLAKEYAQRARTEEPALVNVVTNALVPWSQLIKKLSGLLK